MLQGGGSFMIQTIGEVLVVSGHNRRLPYTFIG
jgi:hypothetical protein